MFKIKQEIPALNILGTTSRTISEMFEILLELSPNQITLTKQQQGNICWTGTVDWSAYFHQLLLCSDVATRSKEHTQEQENHLLVWIWLLASSVVFNKTRTYHANGMHETTRRI